MSFLYAWVFLLLLPLFALMAWYYLFRRKSSPAFQYSSLSALKSYQGSWKVKLHFIPSLFVFIGLGFLIVALARPQQVSEQTSKNVEGVDIVIALDISDSMLIEDMRPENRLVASKKTIREFIEGRISDRIGLVVFSGEAYTRVPLTVDYGLLLKSLDEVQTTRNIKMGTAIGVALATAVGRIKDSEAKSRIVVFLTDGENNSGTIDPETALNIAKEYGIKIYSIGMGVDGQAQLPVYIEDGRGNRIKQYRPMHSKVNEKLLRQFADDTGGRFWRATTGDSLDQVFNEINRLEKTKIDINKYVKYEELFQKYLFYAILFILLGKFFEWTVFRRFP